MSWATSLNCCSFELGGRREFSISAVGSSTSSMGWVGIAAITMGFLTPASRSNSTHCPHRGIRNSLCSVVIPPAAPDCAPVGSADAVERIVVIRERGDAFPAARDVLLRLHRGLEPAGADRQEREDDDVEGLLAIPQPRLVARGWFGDTFFTQPPEVAFEQFALPRAPAFEINLRRRWLHTSVQGPRSARPF